MSDPDSGKDFPLEEFLSPQEAQRRKEFLETLYHAGLAIPIWETGNKKVRISEDRAPGESTTEYSMADATSKTLLGIMLPVNSEGQFLILDTHLHGYLISTKIDDLRQYVPESYARLQLGGPGLNTSTVTSNYLIDRVNIPYMEKLADSSNAPDKIQQALQDALEYSKQKLAEIRENQRRSVQQTHQKLTDFFTQTGLSSPPKPKDDS